MIYVIFNGRLGNNMFQLAAAKTLDPDVQVIALTQNCVDNIKLFADSFFENLKVLSSIPNNVKIYKEVDYSYNPISYNQNENLILEGYFQSEKYIDKKVALQLFQMPEFVKSDIETLFGEILSNNDVIGINVRRGDYLNLPHKHPFCGLKFFNKAISYFGKDKKYIISSDDITWCKKHFIGSNFVFVENSYPLLDLFVQTVCKHNIISNSSFSWWGAYLNPNPEQIIIAPKRWYGIDLTYLNTKDLYTTNMVQIDCSSSLGQRIYAKTLSCKDLVNKYLYEYPLEWIKRNMLTIRIRS